MNATHGKAVVLDFLERAGWSAGQVFFATLLAGTVISVADLPWGKAGLLALGAAITSVVLTAIMYIPKLADLLKKTTSPTVFFWADIAIRLAKTFLATLAGLFTVTVFNPMTFDWPSALNTAALAVLAALSKGLLARGPGPSPDDPLAQEPAAKNPSTLPPVYYVAAVGKNEETQVLADAKKSEEGLIGTTSGPGEP